MRVGLAIALGTCVAAAAPRALASDTYPDAIKDDLMLTSSPGCDLCHNGGVGEKGNVTTPFGKTAVSLGLVSGNTAVLKTVLDEMKAMNTDSDADGTSDIDELVKGTNPNFNEVTGMAPGGADFPPPQYGCSVRAPGSRSRGGRALFFAAGTLGLLALVAPKRRRRDK